jgi:hypothetical protein
MLNDDMLTVVIPIAVMLSVIILSVIMLNVVMLSVILLNVAMPSVVEPKTNNLLLRVHHIKS